jgi:uncharacterized protein YndB with AHSA1/START domain
MNRTPIANCAATLFCALLLSPSAGTSQTNVRQLPTGAFSIEFAVTYPGTPEFVYDRLTGDISPWWDHSFSPRPHKLVIEPRPGGGFYEIFNEKGDGALHATVIYAERGKRLRFEGPLGLSGRAVQAVTTYTLTSAGEDSTTLALEVHLQGEIDEQLASVVNTVWHHFLIERFKPYIEEAVKPPVHTPDH